MHAQAPLRHSWPEPQVLQAAPPLPHVALALVLHWPLESQQPVGQDVASQTQAVPLQRWPAAQLAHVAPFAPQAADVWVVTQLVPLQQPVGQELGVQAHLPALQA